ncbi:Shikimate kinase I [hydrothermal vent metagenome]|uniref:Shikimate kinase I n=1 Tax=hydrothermal vent metagenome TaxID=652676 RepID=A0A3B0TXP7_9ZZZZ
MRVYLVGYMGSGKSTLGRRLSEEMGIQFIDMDDYIEERNHKTIPQIFAEEGENVFREKERTALEELSKFTDVVVATGGGAPCFFDNMELMKKSGTTIFLNIDPEILAERLLDSKIDRPLIKGKSREELIAFINESLQKRLPFYKKAHLQLIKPDADTAELKKQLLNRKKIDTPGFK